MRRLALLLLSLIAAAACSTPTAPPDGGASAKAQLQGATGGIGGTAPGKIAIN